MKPKIVYSLPVLILITAALAIASPGKDKSRPPKYSCNPSIDAWVKSNKHRLENLSRKEIGDLSADSAAGVFACMSPMHKYTLVKEKLLISYTSLTAKEKPYFDDLLKMFSERVYENDTSRKNFIQFTRQWEERVKIDLHWSGIKIAELTATLADQQQIKNRLARFNNIIDPKLNNVCNCTTTVWCQAVLGSNFRCVTQNPCDGNNNDCGVCLCQPCTGFCM